MPKYNKGESQFEETEDYSEWDFPYGVGEEEEKENK
jgi:hypothetical protein